MNIGSVKLDNNLVLAPLAGITDLPFRLLVKEAGCGLVYSEMISSNALVYRSAKTFKMLESRPAEKPLAVQIFGAEPALMATAAQIVANAGADLLDINFGCSVKKVVKTGAGVALMREPQQAQAVLKAVRQAVSIPLTVKIRTGWDPTGNQALRIARIAQDSGVDGIAVHPRTAAQGFRGRADWQIIKAVKGAVTVPVIGNGDIVSAADALKMEAETGCNAVMIGRAAIGNPWIFAQILALKTGAPEPFVDLDRRFDTIRRYLADTIRCYGEDKACRMMRSRLGWFVRGLRYSGKFRESIKHLSSEKEALERLGAFQRWQAGTESRMISAPRRGGCGQ
jgi:nifR3 family TIM-barrel protein